MSASKGVHKNLAQDWIANANKRIMAASGTEIQLENIRVDGERPTERILRVSSTMAEVEEKEHLLRALSGWNSVEVVFQEGEYPEWVLMGVPITRRSHPTDIAKCIAHITNMYLGPRRATFLVRRATIGDLRFSTSNEDTPPETIELNGKLLHIMAYKSYRHSQRTRNIEKPKVTPSQVENLPELPPMPHIL